MAGAFASGFQMGGGIFNQAERNRLEQAAEDRRATEFAQAQEDRARLVGLRDQEDALRNQLTRPNLENYAFAPAGGQGGLGFRAPAAAPAALPEGTGLTMPQLGMPTGGEPTFRPTATMGLEAPAPSTRQPTFNAAPTGADAEQLLGRMALLKGDTAAYRASQEAARGFKYADAYKTARQSWDSMSNDEREALISKASYDTNIPGFGTWVPGKGKTEGYMNYMAPGKDPVKLSASDAREVYALTQAMEHDPMKARADLEKASDKVRSVLAQSFEAQTKGVTQNNLTTYHVSDLAEKGRHNKAVEGIHSASKNIETKISAMESSLGRKLTEEEKLVQFGIEPKKREFNPKDYSSTVQNFVNTGLSLGAASYEADKLYGRAPETKKLDAGLQAANKSKAAGTAAAPIEVRPGESRMTAPGAVVRGPLGDFLRESRRGLFGGVEYFYTDPVTNKRYTTEQYNQLLNQ
jgi:hypothetical protein